MSDHRGVGRIRSLPIVAVLSVSLLAPPAAPASDQPEAHAAYWQTRGCDHGYSMRASRRGIRAVMRSPRRLTRPRGRKAWRFARCVDTRPKASANAQRIRRWRRWRRSYRGWWRIQVERRPGAHARLARLRSGWTAKCPTGESGGDYNAVGPNGRGGPPMGAYQFKSGTWARAQWWVPGRYRTGSPLSASVDHQDAVTDRFFWSHSGEWACSA